MRSQPVGAYTWMNYDWGGAVPIQDGKVWIQMLSNRTNRHCFLYHVTNHLVAGELFNASPVFFNYNQTKLLCDGYSLEGAWKWKLIRRLQTWPFAKRLARKMNRPETFWILNLKDQGEDGAPGRGGNGGVYLRDLSDDSVRTLVEPDHRGQYALARFCADGVIYSRNSLLFWIDLIGSNNAALFKSDKNQ